MHVLVAYNAFSYSCAATRALSVDQAEVNILYIRPIYRVWALTCTRIILYVIFTTGLIHDSPVVVCMRAIYCTQPFCQLELHYVCKGHEQDMVTTAVEAHCCINI